MSAQEASSSEGQSTAACPLCGKADKMQKAKPLYGHMVCNGCRDGFANRRQAAGALDIFVLIYLLQLALAAMLVSQGSAPEDVTTIAWLGSILVFLGKESIGGRSPGKAFFGVRVIDDTNGQPVGLAWSIKRNLPLLIPFMPLIVALQLGKGERTGDGWAHTKVVWQKYADHPIFAPPLGKSATDAETVRKAEAIVREAQERARLEKSG